MDELILKYKPIHDEAKKKALIFTIIAVSLLVIGLIFMFLIGVAPEGSEIVFVGIGIAGIALSIIFFFLMGRATKKWNVIYSNEILPGFIEATYPGARYVPNTGFALNVLMYPEFFARPDRYLSGNYLSSKVEDISFEMADYELQMEQRDKDGHVDYQTYAKGRFIVLTFNRNFKSKLKILEKSFSFRIGSTHKGLKAVELESVDFNKKFNTYSDDATAAFYILTPQMQEKMLGLEKQFKGEMYYMFDDNHLYIAVNDSQASFKYPLFSNFDEEGLNKAMKELLVPKTFIDTLSLNADKFTEDTFDYTI